MEKKVEKVEKNKAKLVKVIVVDNSVNPGWNIGDGVEVMSDDPRIASGHLKEVK